MTGHSPHHVGGGRDVLALALMIVAVRGRGVLPVVGGGGGGVLSLALARVPVAAREHELRVRVRVRGHKHVHVRVASVVRIPVRMQPRLGAGRALAPSAQLPSCLGRCWCWCCMQWAASAPVGVLS